MNHFKIKFWLTLFVAALIGVSCQSNHKEKIIFEKTFEFENSTWNRFKKDSIEFEIKDTKAQYDVIAEVEHNKIADMPTLPLTISLYAPDQSFSSFVGSVNLINNSGKFIGKIVNNDINISQVIIKQRTFPEAGKYKIVFNQRTSKFDLIGVKFIKLKVVKKASKA